MKTEYEIPKDATHYFLWCGEIYIYKKDKNAWFELVSGEWCAAFTAPYHKIIWRFGWRQVSGSYAHKLHKITYTY